MAGLYLSRPCMSVKNVYEGLEIRMCGTLSKENIKILDYVIFLKNMTGWWWQADRCKNRPLTESWRCRLLPLIVLPLSHCPTGPDSWCKFNAENANKTNTHKPRPGLPNDVIYKIRPIYLALAKKLNC